MPYTKHVVRIFCTGLRLSSPRASSPWSQDHSFGRHLLPPTLFLVPLNDAVIFRRFRRRLGRILAFELAPPLETHPRALHDALWLHFAAIHTQEAPMSGIERLNPSRSQGFHPGAHVA